MTLTRTICLPLLLLLVACAGTPRTPDGTHSPGRQAAELNTSLGQEYMSRGQNEIALDKLKKAVAADPHYAPAHTMLAVLYERIREPGLAEEHYQLAVKAAPNNGDVNNNYGIFLCKGGKLSAAESYFLKAVDDPFYRTPAVALANAGTCFLQNNDLDKAEKYLRQSLEYDAEFPDALLPMASVSQKQGAFLRARAFLQRYEATGRESADSLALGVRIETSLGNTKAADAYRQRLMNKFPGSEQGAEIMDRLNS